MHPRVWLLAAGMICAVTATYAVEFFMPKILMDWHGLDIQKLTWLLMLPPALALIAQPLTAWSSDRHQERRWHAVVPILIAASCMACLPLVRDNHVMTVILFMLVLAGCKAYMPAFWSLPNLFLVNTAAAGSIGFINSFGNLGGFIGPTVTGWLQNVTGSFVTSLYCLSGSLLVSAILIFFIATRCQKGRPAPGK
jgi:ACS family tartrate transporter-like MFS transporter